jgi:uncharacterized membrane protein
VSGGSGAGAVAINKTGTVIGSFIGADGKSHGFVVAF